MANWTLKNPILLRGEIGNVIIPIGSSDKGFTGPITIIKMGDGVTAFNLLDYYKTNALDVKAWAKTDTKPAYTYSEVGAAPLSHGTHVTYGAAMPKNLGTAAAGTSSSLSREDHVHAKQIDITGNAATSSEAVKLSNARNIGDASFDGTKDISLAEIGAAPLSHGTHVTYGAAMPKDLGIAAIGTSSSLSREDHVHAKQTDIAGNAATASKLKTSIGVSISGGGTAAKTNFDGSEDIDINITSLDATKLNGLIPMDCIPQGALERFYPVQDQAAMLALTIDDVQNGDVVKIEDSNNVMYFVKNESLLGTMDAFHEFSSGTASAVDWIGITNKPTSFTPSSHNHGNITNDGKIGTVTGTVIVTGADGVLQTETKNSAFNKAFESSAAVYQAAGTAAVGSSTKLPRADHVHPAQTEVTGNSATATKLKTAITVDGISFDGTANITHYGVCSTTGSVAEKAVNIPGFNLVNGSRVLILFEYTNTGDVATLNINSTGPKVIQTQNMTTLYNDDVEDMPLPPFSYIKKNKITEFVYDSTLDKFILIQDIDFGFFVADKLSDFPEYIENFNPENDCMLLPLAGSCGSDMYARFVDETLKFDPLQKILYSNISGNSSGLGTRSADQIFKTIVGNTVGEYLTIPTTMWVAINEADQLYSYGYRYKLEYTSNIDLIVLDGGALTSADISFITVGHLIDVVFNIFSISEASKCEIEVMSSAGSITFISKFLPESAIVMDAITSKYIPSPI